MRAPSPTLKRHWTHLTCLLAVMAFAVPSLAQSLDERISHVVDRMRLPGAQVGLCVVDTSTGKILASVEANRPLIPASNMKLLSSGAALLTLPEDFVFRTEVLVQGDRLILRGSGDPALGDPVILDESQPPMSIDDLLDRMAEVIQKRSPYVREVIVDDRVFDREYAHQTWPEDQLNRWYCAEIGGVNIHTNVINVYVSPSSSGGKPGISWQPNASFIEVANRARTSTSGSNSIWVARPAPDNEFTVYGKARYTTRQPVRVAIHNPPEFAGELLAQKLADRGVRFDNPPADRVRLAGETERFDTAAPLLAVTTTLDDVLRRCNVNSYNLYAEALIKRVGHEVTGEPGSWSNGGAVVRMLLGERLDAEAAANTTIADGSGMSRDNRVSPEVLARWLASIYTDEHAGPRFVASLAKPGEGTLDSRFRGIVLSNTVAAKSGYLTGVYALSGYVIDDNGEAVAFSILLNDVQRGTASKNAKPFHEAVVAEIDAWMRDRRTANMGG